MRINNFYKEILGGFNTLVSTQQAVPGKATMTVVLFDSKYEVLVDGVKLSKVKPLTERDYFPRDVTALREAVCRAILDYEKFVSSRKAAGKRLPDKVLFHIMTDGAENASDPEYSVEMLESLIAKHEGPNFVFSFVGADMDSMKVGKDLGIRNLGGTMSFSNTAGSGAAMYAATSDAATAFRASADHTFAYSSESRNTVRDVSAREVDSVSDTDTASD